MKSKKEYMYFKNINKFEENILILAKLVPYIKGF